MHAQASGSILHGTHGFVEGVAGLHHRLPSFTDHIASAGSESFSLIDLWLEDFFEDEFQLYSAGNSTLKVKSVVFHSSADNFVLGIWELLSRIGRYVLFCSFKFHC